MAESKGLTIHPPKEEEIVINAGLPLSQDTPGVHDASKSSGSTPSKPQPSKVLTGDAGSQTSNPKTQRPQEQPTTLEDLRSQKMGVTQKVVLVAALVGLVIFIVWYWLTYGTL